jgi:hypothetical protein
MVARDCARSRLRGKSESGCLMLNDLLMGGAASAALADFLWVNLNPRGISRR